jgi:hypothetical protein
VPELYLQPDQATVYRSLLTIGGRMSAGLAIDEAGQTGSVAASLRGDRSDFVKELLLEQSPEDM